MTHNKATFISLKSFLFLIAGIFAVAVTLLIFFLGSAATVTGGTPFSAVTLAAFFYGWHGGETPEMASTMAFVTLSFSELLRAFTARSEHYPLLKIGFFSNPTMFVAVLVSLVLLLAVIYVPFLQPVFNTVPLTLVHWEVLLPLLAIPSVVAEISKWLVSRKLVVEQI